MNLAYENFWQIFRTFSTLSCQSRIGFLNFFSFPSIGLLTIGCTTYIQTREQNTKRHPFLEFTVFKIRIYTFCAPCPSWTECSRRTSLLTLLITFLSLKIFLRNLKFEIQVRNFDLSWQSLLDNSNRSGISCSNSNRHHSSMLLLVCTAPGRWTQRRSSGRLYGTDNKRTCNFEVRSNSHLPNSPARSIFQVAQTLSVVESPSFLPDF